MDDNKLNNQANFYVSCSGFLFLQLYLHTPFGLKTAVAYLDTPLSLFIIAVHREEGQVRFNAKTKLKVFS